MTSHSFFMPDWPSPANIKSFCTTRHGGASLDEYTSLNIASHVGDNRQHIEANRQQLSGLLGLPGEPFWLQQVHGNRVVEIEKDAARVDSPADAAYSNFPGKVLTIMVADCLPVLLASSDGGEIAAVHAGWRGLASNVLGHACKMFNQQHHLMAWLGPAIGPCHYEVGPEVRQAFSSEQQVFFTQGKDSQHWWLDLYQVARWQLARLGVEQIYGGNYCTYHENSRFYSYRKEGRTGRFGVFIWME